MWETSFCKLQMCHAIWPAQKLHLLIMIICRNPGIKLNYDMISATNLFFVLRPIYLCTDEAAQFGRKKAPLPPPTIFYKKIIFLFLLHCLDNCRIFCTLIPLTFLLCRKPNQPLSNQDSLLVQIVVHCIGTFFNFVLHKHNAYQKLLRQKLRHCLQKRFSCRWKIPI